MGPARTGCGAVSRSGQPPVIAEWISDDAEAQGRWFVVPRSRTAFVRSTTANRL